MSDPSAPRFGLASALAVFLVVVAGLASILATTSGPDEPAGALACAGREQQVKTGTVVRLDARCSELTEDAAASDELVFFWLLRVRPAGSAAELRNAQTFNPSFVADRDGEYLVRLMVRSTSRTGSRLSDVKIVASPGNVPPVAHAGETRQVKVGDSVSLDGSLSSDADGDLLSYAWTLDLPLGVGVALSDESSPVPVVATPVQTRYELSLRVSDGAAESARDRAFLVVTRDGINACPDADAGPDQRVTTGTPVVLDGSASRDADGDSLAYRWRMVWRPPGSNAVLDDPDDNPTPGFVADVDGAYIIKLRVDDADTNAGRTANCADILLDVRDTVVVFAASGNSGPVAAAGADQTVAVNDTVSLNGAGSSDADGDALAYQWQFVSLPAASAAILSDPSAIDPTFTADAAGSYVLRLTASDGFAADSDNLVVVAEPVVIGPTRPLADAGPDQAVTVGDSVQLDASASRDPNGDPLTYAWTWLDWPGAPNVAAPALDDPTAVGPVFLASAEGSYVLRLVVSDGAESSLPDTVSVSAAAAGACTDSLSVITALPYQPGVGESASIVRISGDEVRLVDSGERLDSDVLEARFAGGGATDQADFVVLPTAWEEFSRSHTNPIADSESPVLVVQRLADGIYFRLAFEFTVDADLFEVQIDALTVCRCGADATACPP